MQPRRSIATVLFTDIIGSTERASALGDRRWRDILARHHALVREQLTRFGGQEIATAGDGFLAVFTSPARAILCAAAIREAVAELGLEVRCGLHLGEVERSDGAVGGIAVHIGARVAAHAGANEILVSSTVRDAEAGSEFDFEDRGSHELKGVPGEWRLFAVTALPDDVEAALHEPAPEPKAGLRRWRPLLAVATALGLILVGLALFLVVRDRDPTLTPTAALASAAPGVAILPFSVNDPELQRWREGLVDLLATNLDGAAGLRAIDSRTVLARWRERVRGDDTPDLATSLEVARASGGRYALVGSVVSSGTNMRVLADVYDLERDDRLGQEQIEGAPDSIFGLVDRLSIAVLRRILERRGGEIPQIDLASVTTTSLPALKAFLEAEALARRSDFEHAIPLYERALEADSTFALAALRGSQAYGWIEGLETDRGVVLLHGASRFAEHLPPRDRDVLETALALFGQREDASRLARDLTSKYPDDPYAWFLLGDVTFHLPYQTLAVREERERPFLQALRLDPTYTPAYIHLLDLAFQHADSARLTELLPRYDRLAQGSAYDARYRLAYRLTFGDPAERAAAGLEIDSLPTMFLGRLVGLLQHPRFVDIGDRLAAALIERPDLPAGMVGGHEVLDAIRRGRIRRAGELLATPEIPPIMRTRVLSAMIELETPLPEGLVERALDASPDSGRGSIDFVYALRAIRDRRWVAFEAQLTALESSAQTFLERGDSLIARSIDGAVLALRGRAAMERGRNEEARELLEKAFRASGQPIAAAWLARLHEQAGRHREAVRYLEMSPPDPWVALRLAPLYEELGERDRAIEAYGWITLAWAEADPELQPRVLEARSAIARLQGLQRG